MNNKNNQMNEFSIPGHREKYGDKNIEVNKLYFDARALPRSSICQVLYASPEELILDYQDGSRRNPKSKESATETAENLLAINETMLHQIIKNLERDIAWINQRTPKK